MSRAERARQIAARAAWGGGRLAAGAGVAGAVGAGVLALEARIASGLTDGTPGNAPDDGGRYGAGLGEPYRLLVLGDSTANGVGASTREQTIAGICAGGLAALSGRPVDVVNVAVNGDTSHGLESQVTRGLEAMSSPHAALVVIGGNDVVKRAGMTDAVRLLGEAVARLREAGAEVVVATCPDLGMVTSIPQPLRFVIQRWSRDLAAAQTVTVVEQGGRTVSMGDLIYREFRANPQEMFHTDRFHPSAAGYARAASVLLPSICDAVGLSAPEMPAPQGRRRDGIRPLTEAAARAVRLPGLEVRGARVNGYLRGVGGRWAQEVRRRRTQLASAAGEQPAAQRLADEEPTGADEQPDGART